MGKEFFLLKCNTHRYWADPYFINSKRRESWKHKRAEQLHEVPNLDRMNNKSVNLAFNCSYTLHYMTVMQLHLQIPDIVTRSLTIASLIVQKVKGQGVL